jgi:hypothetical protein
VRSNSTERSSSRNRRACALSVKNHSYQKRQPSTTVTSQVTYELPYIGLATEQKVRYCTGQGLDPEEMILNYSYETSSPTGDETGQETQSTHNMENLPEENVEEGVVENEYQGYSLFFDVEDTDLRARNRSIVMYNVYDDHSKNGVTSAKALPIMLGYLQKIPLEERADVVARFRLMTQERPKNVS